MTLYCTCEAPVMDVEHDAGCRRCGLPVDFSPSGPVDELQQRANEIAEADRAEDYNREVAAQRER